MAFAKAPTPKSEAYPPLVIEVYVPSLPKKPIKVQISKKSSHQANITLAQEIATAKGIVGAEWQCLYTIGMKESGWNHLAKNAQSGAYGIPQSLPASKLDSYGDRNDPAVQIRWMIDYIAARYQTPCNALTFHQSHNWY